MITSCMSKHYFHAFRPKNYITYAVLCVASAALNALLISETHAQTAVNNPGPTSKPCHSVGVSNDGTMISICKAKATSGSEIAFYSTPTTPSQTALAPYNVDGPLRLNQRPYINAAGMVGVTVDFMDSNSSTTLEQWDNAASNSPTNKNGHAYLYGTFKHIDSAGDATAAYGSSLMLFPSGSSTAKALTPTNKNCSFSGASFNSTFNGAPVVAATCAFGKSRTAAVISAVASSDGSFPSTFTITQLRVPDNYARCEATGINDNFRIVGTCFNSRRRVATYWDPAAVGTPTYTSSKFFTSVPSIDSSEAKAINTQGNILVNVVGDNGEPIAWIWSPQGFNTFLNDSAGRNTVGISDNNTVFANGQDANQQKAAYVYVAGNATATPIIAPAGSTWLAVTSQSANGTYAAADVQTGTALITMP